MKLRDLQFEFAAHLRDPSRHPAPRDVEDRRMQVYRELFFNNVSGLLAGTFPVVRRILGDERWRQLVRGFYAQHRCQTPLFLEVPAEFLTYLRDERSPQPDDPPFLEELAHYEWIELAQSVDPQDVDISGVDRAGDLVTGVPVLNPLAVPLAYRYPVHRLAPEYQPDTPPEEPSFYVVYRDLADKVGFLEINALTARLLELIESAPDATGREHIEQLARELAATDSSTLMEPARDALVQLRRHDVVLGTRLAMQRDD